MSADEINKKTDIETNTLRRKGNDLGGARRGGRCDNDGEDCDEENIPEVTVENVVDYIPIPPNGGWGWVIVVSSLVNNLLVDGISYSFGVFLLEFVDAFKETKSKVSLVGSLLSGVYLFVGPIVSALTNKYGCRLIVISGSIIATSGFVLATFSPDIDILLITYGVIGGFGLGMIYLPSIVMVGLYFDTKRAFATGLAVCGSGLGTFIFPPLSEFLLAEFSWQGGLLIIGGIMFHGCVCGSLMRPLEARPASVKPGLKPRAKNFQDRLKKSTATRNRSVSESIVTTYTVRDRKIQEREIATKVEREKCLQDTLSELGSNPSVAAIGQEEGDDIQGSVGTRWHNPSLSRTADTNYLRDHEPVSIRDQETGIRSSGQVPTVNGVVEGSYEIMPIDEDFQARQNQIILDIQPKQTENLPNGVSQITIVEITPLLDFSAATVRPRGFQLGSQASMHVSREDLARPLYRKDIFYSGSVLNIPEFRSQPDIKSYITSITVIPQEVDSARPGSLARFCKCLPRPVQDVLKEMLDVSLLKDISFMFICLGNFAAFLGMYVPFTFLVDRTAQLGVDRSRAAFLISIIGISNTAGRIAIGTVADLHIVDSLVITYASIALSGVATGLVPFCNTYILLAIDAAVFGLGMAAFITLSSIVICDRMGVEKLTNAFGLLTLVRGIAAIFGPPLTGFMFDSSGSYDLSFFIGGLLLLIGAACLALLHLPGLRSTRRDQELVMQNVGREDH